MQQALEALDGVLDDDPKVLEASISGGLYEVVQCRDAITALRTALAMHQVSEFAQAQEQAEPSQWRDMVVVSLVREGVNKHRARELADHFAAQQQAEPVAWVFTPNNDLLWPHEVEVTNPIELNSYQPLYTTPPQRQWVGLEPEEILDLFDRNNVYGSKWIEFARTVEVKLKERNHD